MEFKKGINFYVIHLPKTHNDTITTESGVELFIDPEWNPHHHRILKAKLVCIPKHEKFLKVDDIVHFHPNVVNNDGFHLGGGFYAIPYNEKMSMIFAKENEGEQFTPVFNYLFVKKEEDKDVEVSNIKVTTSSRDKGVVAFLSDYCKKTLPVKIGDDISYRKLRGFTVGVDGVPYVRLRKDDVNFVYG